MIGWQDLGAAIALLLIFEGLMPFFSPDRLRRTLDLIKQLDDSQLRRLGLSLMVVGVIILYLVRYMG